MDLRERIKNLTITDHLYGDKTGYLIRLAIWYLSWIGGVVVLQGKTDGVGSAYFLLSISYLLEFVPQINTKEGQQSRIFHTIFCAVMFFIFVASAFSIFCNYYSNRLHKLMFFASSLLIAYMSIDCVILWCSREASPSQMPLASQIPSQDDAISHFNDRLQHGGLGNISEEDFNV